MSAGSVNPDLLKTRPSAPEGRRRSWYLSFVNRGDVHFIGCVLRLHQATDAVTMNNAINLFDFLPLKSNRIWPHDIGTV